MTSVVRSEEASDQMRDGQKEQLVCLNVLAYPNRIAIQIPTHIKIISLEFEQTYKTLKIFLHMITRNRTHIRMEGYKEE